MSPVFFLSVRFGCVCRFELGVFEVLSVTEIVTSKSKLFEMCQPTGIDNTH